MVINRKGKMSKWNKIQKALERATNIDEAYIILEPFNLTNEENCTIAQQWQLGKQIIARYRGI
jgi:hypothetical protein